jgi:3D (Asp-Asp-Asp) domain-containing protein
MKPIFGGSALVAALIVLGSIALSARSSVAETLISQFQQQKQQQAQNLKGPGTPVESPGSEEAVPSKVSSSSTLSGTVSERSDSETKASVLPSVNYVATAYSLRGKTASGKMVSRGLIAADPSFLPLGSRVRVEAGGYSGEYLVADTGGAVRGRRIDIWIPSAREAMRFGRRTVKLTILSLGLRRSRRTAKT